MKIIPFAPKKFEGEEQIMETSGLNIEEIRFNVNSREMRLVVTESQFTEDSVADMSWQAIKKNVLENGGEWTNKTEGITFLLNQ